MVLDAIDELATGFEGCEKKLEIDFNVSDEEEVDLRDIPRDALDSILSLARCTIISKQSNKDFDAYVLSESSLFIYQSKIMLKTCGTTLLLKCTSALLSAARSLGATPDFIQFSRSNFLFPSKQHFPHRAFTEETDYLNEQLGVKGEAYILGSLNGARWHLWIWDFNQVDAKEYHQQTLEIIMFNLSPQKMKTFYKADADAMETDRVPRAGEPCFDGIEASRVSGIDDLMPGAKVDSHQFTPCGYSCNACIDVSDIQAIINKNTIGTRPTPRIAAALNGAKARIGKQGAEQQAYFTIHITPEPQCSFVSFETNAVLPNYTALVRSVVNTFQPGSFCVSLFVDGGSIVSDSRAGLAWEHPGYITKGTTHHAFEAGYNATVSQYEAAPGVQISVSSEYGGQALSNEAVDTKHSMAVPPKNSPRASPMSASLVLAGLNGLPSSYQTVASLSLEQMRAVAVAVAKKQKFELHQEEEFSLNNGEAKPLSMQSVIDSLISKATMVDEAFTLVDLGALVRRFYQWSQTYQRIEPVFELYGRTIPAGVASILSALGCHISCLSSQAASNLLADGIPASRLLLDIPVMSASQIMFAHQQRIDLLSAGSLDELKAIATMHGLAEVLLSVAFDANDSYEIAFSPAQIDEALALAKDLKVKICGIQVKQPAVIEKHDSQKTSAMLKQLAEIYARASQAGQRFSCLDLGSQLPSSSSAFSSELNTMLKSLFDEDDIRILAHCREFFDQDLSVVAGKVRHVQTLTEAATANGNGHATSSPVLKKRRASELDLQSHSRALYVNDAIVAAIRAEKCGDVVAAPSTAAKSSLVSTLLAGIVEPGANSVSASLSSALHAGEWVQAPISVAGLEAAGEYGIDAPRTHFALS